MKKYFSILMILLFVSCGPAKLVDPLTSNNCENATENYLKTVEAWSNDIGNKSKCEAVKKTINDLLKSCSVYTAAQRKVYEDQLKDFNCDN